MKDKVEFSILPEFEQETLQEQAYQRIRHALLVGRLKPGSTLTLRGVANALDVSLTPVRTALKRLEAEKAIALKDNRRILIPEMNLQKLQALINLRVKLETHAAEQAIKHVSDELLDQLIEIDSSINDAVEKEDWEQAVIQNQHFHCVIYKADPYQVCLPMLYSIWLQLAPILQLAAAGAPKFYTIDRHLEAIDALRNKDIEALKLALTNDILDGVDFLSIDALLRTLTEH